MAYKLVLAVAALALLVLVGFYLPTVRSMAPPLPTIINPYLNSTKLPDLSVVKDVKEKKQLFFGYLAPLVVVENSHIMQLREGINSISQTFDSDGSLYPEQQVWLQAIAKKYKIKQCDVFSEQCHAQLLLRVDIVPVSLVLAQAANESAWGTSRFAVAGNNIFGQWCFYKGCGLVPQERSGNENHEVKSFETVHHSVRSYMMNLNTHRSYAELRDIRQEKRQNGELITGVDLAQGLIRYSERGEAYVSEIIGMINYNGIASYDVPPV